MSGRLSSDRVRSSDVELAGKAFGFVDINFDNVDNEEEADYRDKIIELTKKVVDYQSPRAHGFEDFYYDDWDEKSGEPQPKFSLKTGKSRRGGHWMGGY